MKMSRMEKVEAALVAALEPFFDKTPCNEIIGAMEHVKLIIFIAETKRMSEGKKDEPQ